ncbi:MAG: type II toxin-antitoxin system PemK/MazF family toxin [Dysgonamonadaceae bacterium]|jgi:mRNA-degrading endonuclease toxin of MazEF toxin-antitoxin module|nr:type II toxin-antitoxin system PemK/MazF family toxin [Dysgonamonadaceae bacterium]
MKINQRDIVSVNFIFPDGSAKPHYAIVVSNNELTELEGFVYLVLITSKDYHSEYYFELSNDMLLNFQLDKKSYVKCHILMATIDTIISIKVGQIKKVYFEQIKEKIISSIF